MSEEFRTRVKQYYYDPDKGEEVLVKDGYMTPVDPSTLSPKIRKLLAELREEGERFERELKERARKSA